MGRLIDADELLTAFPIDDEPTLTKSCVRMTIQHMPTIEPQRWIPVGKENDMKIIIHYKNGFELPVECESIQVETDIYNNLNGYQIKGIKVNKPLYISMKDVLCIWRDGENDGKTD